MIFFIKFAPVKLVRTSKQLLTALFLIGYIFVVFFTSFLHTHNEHNPTNSFDSVQKSFNKGISQDNLDCLACHILYEGKHLSLNNIDFNFYVSQYHFQIEVVKPLFKYNNYTKTLFLRGPPCFSFVG